MTYQDKTLVCADCGQEFTFSAEDQQFHASRGYQDPKRCPDCRQARRSERGGGSSGYGGGSRTLYDAVCASCGAAAQVPFQPRQDRPVYCSDCFSKVRTGRPRW
ncbi:MAG: zinc-ribbon domain containing protein [Chloroflexi bacterium]|nr:zinc-ribbon domain containing protein [Chloroflexota bacterium]